MNKIVKISCIIVITVFLSLYFSKYNMDYYENKNVLTEEAIKQFEKNKKEGKQIIASNYLPKEKNYDNKISKIGIKTSEIIEKTFDKGLKVVMNYLNNIQND